MSRQSLEHTVEICSDIVDWCFSHNRPNVLHTLLTLHLCLSVLQVRGDSWRHMIPSLISNPNYPLLSVNEEVGSVVTGKYSTMSVLAYCCLLHLRYCSCKLPKYADPMRQKIRYKIHTDHPCQRNSDQPIDRLLTCGKVEFGMNRSS